MTDLKNVIIRRAEKKATLLIKDAKKQRAFTLKAIKKKAEADYETLMQGVRRDAERNANLKTSALVSDFKKWKLSEKKKIFDALRLSIIHKIESKPKKLFNKVVSSGKKKFKNPEIQAGKNFSKLFRNAKIKSIDGIRVGSKGVYFSAEIPEVVDEYFSENYRELLDKLFGD